ncbi:MAG: hypothetical protein PHG00_16325 [Methylococcales bacterium]|nr:hypothetical protein [Methylococcales bacterium]
MDRSETPKTQSLGAPTTSRALQVLFDAAKDVLSKDELSYLADMGELAASQSRSLSDSLMTMGCLYANTDSISKPGAQTTAEIFWSLSYQLDHIAGLIELAESAAYKLQKGCAA